MRVAIQLLCVVACCVGCESLPPPRAETAPVHKTVSLPEMSIEGVDYADGISFDEAGLVGAAYFRRVVGLCGMPDTPRVWREFWLVQLWGGYGGSDWGRLLLRKDGSAVLLEPPKRGFTSATREFLRTQGISYE